MQAGLINKFGEDEDEIKIYVKRDNHINHYFSGTHNSKRSNLVKKSKEEI